MVLLLLKLEEKLFMKFDEITRMVHMKRYEVSPKLFTHVMVFQAEIGSGSLPFSDGDKLS